MEYEVLNELIKNPQPLRFIFHLLVVLQPEDYEPDSWQLEPDEKLASVAKLKELGNEYLQKASFECFFFFFGNLVRNFIGCKREMK